MNPTRYVLSTIAVFVFVFLSEFLIHGCLLKGIYTQTAHIWRPEGEHPMVFMFFSQFFFSAFTAFLYTRHHEGKGIGEGVRFGLYLGCILASIELASYCYLPIPLTLSFAWMGASLTKCLGAGLLCALIYKK